MSRIDSAGRAYVVTDPDHPLAITADVHIDAVTIAAAEGGATADKQDDLITAITTLTGKIDDLIALLPAALTANGNLKIAIEEDNTGP